MSWSFSAQSWEFWEMGLISPNHSGVLAVKLVAAVFTAVGHAATVVCWWVNKRSEFPAPAQHRALLSAATVIAIPKPVR